MEKFLYFQPEYVGRFKCDGAKCDARCCKFWNIDIDEKTYEQYSQLQPPEVAKEILSYMKFNDERKINVIALNEKKSCPFLTEKNLCRLQLEYGEKFLSIACATYPRITYDFVNFFERSLSLTCPVAAEMILFAREPLKFEFVEVPEEIHSNGGKIFISSLFENKYLASEMFGIQGTMISILQERRLSINQRLSVLNFFLAELDALFKVKNFSAEEIFHLINSVRKLTASYSPQIFLREGVPPKIQKTSFNAEKFIALMISIFGPIYIDNFKMLGAPLKYLYAVVKILNMTPTDEQRMTVEEIAANYVALAEAREKFFAEHSTFLENYLVNEFFYNFYPWKFFTENFAKNLAVFVVSYKVFELIIFSATLKGCDKREDLLNMVYWFTRKIDHQSELQNKILELFKDDENLLALIESLLEV